MDLTLNITLAATFLIVAYQDIKTRFIHVFLPVFILILGIAIKWTTLNWIEAAYCLVFLLFNFLVVTLYFSVKKRELINPFQNMIGLGDLLFLIALVPFFSLRNYIVFFVLGMIFSLALYLIMKSLYHTEKTIPLAGYLSIFMLGIIGINTFIDNSFLQ